ncbi:hypothetical protein RAS1_32850 [Phycisphaerae bacterium RAS1]|nr:hypothetical protein RAS1_32850 [Phycisphaerae bacterium RAS1]
MLASRRPAAAIALGLFLLPLSGCFTVIKQAYFEARGAQGKVVVVTDTASTELDRCGSIEFEPSTSDVGSKLCPPKLLTDYDLAIADLKQKQLPARFGGGAPAARVTSQIYYFQEKGFFGQAMCIARLKFSGAAGQILDVMIISESKAYRAGGEKDLANACAKALGKFLLGEKYKEEDEKHSDSND